MYNVTLICWKTNKFICCYNCNGKKERKNEWVLSPGGKQIIKSGKTGVFFLKKIENNLVISTFEDIYKFKDIQNRTRKWLILIFVRSKFETPL